MMDLFEGLNGPEQIEAANNSGQEQDAPDSGHHTSVQTSSSVVHDEVTHDEATYSTKYCALLQPLELL